MNTKDIQQFMLHVGDEAWACRVEARGDFSRAIQSVNQTVVPDAHIPAVFRMGDGSQVDVVLLENRFYYLVHLNSITITANYTASGGELVMCPSRRGREDQEAKSNPIFSMQWVPPMPHFLALLPRQQLSSHKDALVEQAYMFCIHEGQIFRPPLPNTYEDGRLCWGNTQPQPGKAPTVYDLLVWFMDEFTHSTWNSDLGQNVTGKFIRFKPNKDKGFTQSNPGAETYRLLQAVSSSRINKIYDLCIK